MIFDTESEARDYSRAEAIARGCGDTTLYWYGWRQTLDGRWQVLDGTGQAQDFPSAEEA